MFDHILVKCSICYFENFWFYRKLAKNKKAMEETDPDLASRQTSQDYEDACNEELAKFELSPRTTRRNLQCVDK